MQIDEMTKMCERLAGKYKNGQMRDDLIQEGLVACLEILAEEPECHPAKLHRAANKAMWDHLNFSGVPVSVPKSRASREVLRSSDVDSSQTYSENGLEALRIAVKAKSVSLKEDDLITDDCSADFEEREFYQFIATKVDEYLEGDDLMIVKMRYYHDMTQDEVGDVMGMSKQAVSKRETQALEKLKRKLKQFVN